ncbi:MAG TPA: tail fiber domain-containing protein [Xanthomonadaceae bacterium]|nr:tail fiber domain-containing protein [Xanthomonadaceae bacterium]
MSVRIPLAAAGAVLLSLAGVAQAGSFTYRGYLEDGAAPAEGRYDFRLTPYADATTPIPAGAAALVEGVVLNAGQFAAALDADAIPGHLDQAWLEVEVRAEGEGGWWALPGRQVVAPKGALCPPSWELTGNAGTNPATNFLGTTNDQPIELRVRNGRGFRIEPSPNFWNGLPLTINTIGGSHGNLLTAGVRGATISGGGVAPGATDPDFTGVSRNRITDHYGVVGGGFNNRAGNDGGTLIDASNATVGGGRDNVASGRHSTVAGGRGNIASASESSVLGGQTNTASGARSVAGGGLNNLVSGGHAAALGGIGNLVSGSSAFLGAGNDGVASGSLSVIAGGQANTASGMRGAVLGGVNNSASGNDSSITGGSGNCAGGTNSWAGGNRAKVRPGTNAGEPGQGCAGIGGTGTTTGDAGTFIWADNQNADYVSGGPNRFLVRASGGVVFTADSINNPQDNLLRVNGTLRLDTLGSAGATTLCRNAVNQIASCSSSARYKSDIADLDSGIDIVERLRAVSYVWSASGESDIGFVAEEVAAIDPRLVTRNEAGEVEGVKYDRLSALLAVAVQTLAARYDEQAATLAALQAENARLSERMSTIDADQSRSLAELRAELALLRELVAPAVADGGR